MITHCKVIQQHWKRSDNVVAQYYETSSFVGANQLCIATPESCSTSNCQRDAPDGISIGVLSLQHNLRVDHQILHNLWNKLL